MVNTISIGIGLLITAIAIVVIFIAIKRFGVPLGEDIGSVFGGFGKGITDFFDRISSSTETTEERNQRDAEEIFERQLEEKEQQAIDAGFDSVEEFEQATDTTSIFNASLEDLTKFNPEGIIGFGIEGLNEGRGIEDTQENRALLFDIIQSAGERGITDVRDVDFSPFSGSFQKTTTQAVQDAEPTEVIPLDSREAFIGGTDRLDDVVRIVPIGTLSKEDLIFITQFSQTKDFQVFGGTADTPATGIIRETIQDSTQLQLDSFGNPIETASERASRVFEETGQFANEDFDIISDAERRAQEFDFGTATGEGLKIPTGTQDIEELSIEEKKRIEALKSTLVFDSRSISNF